LFRAKVNLVQVPGTGRVRLDKKTIKIKNNLG